MDISQRHFQDISDSSFQIPSFDDTGLLSDDRLGNLGLEVDPFDDEVGGLDSDPFTTPLPSPPNHSPLTLSEITPQREKGDVIMAFQHEGTTNHGQAEGGATEKQTEKDASVRHILPKKESVDDMFQRRKRDSYQQMGLDLSSKSTARLQHGKGELGQRNNTHTVTIPSGKASTVAAGRQIKAPESHVNDARKVTGKAKKRPVLDKDAGIAKHRSHVATSTTQPKSILKPSKPPPTIPPSTFARTLTTAQHTPEADRPRWGDVVAEVQQTSERRQSSGSGIAAIGGGLIDVLVMYGEKLRGSLGLSSSASKPSTPDVASTAAGSRSSAGKPLDTSILEDSTTTHPQESLAGPSSRPLSPTKLSPSRYRHQGDVLTLSDLSPSKRDTVDKENEMSTERQANVSPMRPSRKRPSDGMLFPEGKKGKLNVEMASQAPSASAQPFTGLSKVTRAAPAVGTSKPKPLGLSGTVNKATIQPRLKTQPIGTVTSKRDLKVKPHEKSTVATQRPLATLTLPPGPASASDVNRQRALERTQKGRERTGARGEKVKEKTNFKAAGATPHFSKPAPPARPAIRPTIPAAFTFHSDARAAQRNAELEAKRQTWRSHTMPQALPMPDFAALHAAQEEAMRSRQVVPVTRSEAPALTTMVRAKEREKFEAERRERERAVEQQREMRERERAEQEERAYREARKRTVPKAHEVPEWYKDLRK
ncbi:hypothetical protein JB92DRAFT_3115728 [Gautieria morchelliformis]|nr:hypothetical protein JB92DRAFT_3115728 [Gautieria morchelliformis]